MDKKLTWIDKKGLEEYANKLLKSHPELVRQYHTRKIKNNTYIIDFKDIEDKAGAGLQENLCLNNFERDVYSSICVLPDIENFAFDLSFQPILERLTNKQRFVLDKRLEGFTQQEIAFLLRISRKNVNKHLNFIKLKIIKYWRRYEDIYDHRLIFGSLS